MVKRELKILSITVIFFALCILGWYKLNLIHQNDILDGKEIVIIKLESADGCKTMKTTPFTESIVTYEKVDELRIFKRAINIAVIEKGDIDYCAMFFMYLLLEDGTQMKFVLNVADEAGRTALLVDIADRGQGYEIPKDQTAELRKIIYQAKS
ncbi:hypothetical protein [Paenibacillus sp. BC26]|uniref:hypothetical protein n=1 Tax=Paenibacillus sp. BC26 TaxID=1881032 RepID=UPI0008E7995B|nr:hypothetical protein [Paenibacillus sp. BC26]SFS76908.1 hypothetical protein SAMN05428962_2749 [Paenibacillus sp. BC26]